jgi:hypothetical protein
MPALYGDNKVTTIRNLINQSIGDYLGTFANGEKAIWIEPPIPPEFGQGMHCIIKRYSRRLGLTSNYEWLINLVFVPANIEAVDETNQSKFDQCIDKFRDAFPRSREIHQVYRGFYPQITFMFNYEKEAYL